MSQTHIAIIFFILLTSVVLPFIIRKYNIKDDIKHEKTLPIGTAQFRAFIKLAVWLFLSIAFIGLVINTFDLLGF